MSRQRHPLSLSRSARYRKAGGFDAERYAYEKWTDALTEHRDDPDLKRDLMKIGRDRGWVVGRTFVPPGADPPSPNDVMNDEIRRAAGRDSIGPVRHAGRATGPRSS